MCTSICGLRADTDGSFLFPGLVKFYLQEQWGQHIAWLLSRSSPSPHTEGIYDLLLAEFYLGSLQKVCIFCIESVKFGSSFGHVGLMPLHLAKNSFLKLFLEGLWLFSGWKGDCSSMNRRLVPCSLPSFILRRLVAKFLRTLTRLTLICSTPDALLQKGDCATIHP